MSSDENKALREQLIENLRCGQAHIDFESAMKGVTAKLGGMQKAGVPHTIWQLLEHLRIAQHDILEFSRNPKHKSPQWPEGYWPKAEAPATEMAWDESVAAFQKEAKEMEELIGNAAHDLFQPIEGGEGQTLLREALVLSAHNSYHLGQLVYLKKMLLPPE
jgi:hypothetical protein